MTSPDRRIVEDRLGGMQRGAWRVRGASGVAVLKWIGVDPDDACASA